MVFDILWCTNRPDFPECKGAITDLPLDRRKTVRDIRKHANTTQHQPYERVLRLLSDPASCGQGHAPAH